MDVLMDAGLFSELHTLNLTDVFSTSQQSEQQKESLLTDIIQGTCGELRRLYLANAHMGEEASQAIAHKCAQLKELSLPGCAGLTATGLKSIALACKHLQVLRIGGGLVRWLPSIVLALFRKHTLPDSLMCRKLWAHGCMFK